MEKNVRVMEQDNGVRVDMCKEKIRSLVSIFYSTQKLRISTGNRIVASLRGQLGIETTEEATMGEDGQATDTPFVKQMLKEYQSITEYYVEQHKSIRKVLCEMQDELSIIRSEMDFKLVEQYTKLLSVEKDTEKIIKKEVESHPLYEAFFKDVKGCGPMMSAICISYFDPYKARHVASFWKYAGLDVVRVENENGEIVGEARGKKHTEFVEYADKNGEVKSKKSITYNPVLKSKLIGVLGGSFLKSKDSYYGDIYRDYKFRLQNNKKYEEYSKGHIHNMAMRYAVKMFVRDLWVAWREVEGLPITQPYEVEKLGNRPHRYNETHFKSANF